MTEPRRLADNSLVELLDRLVQTGVVATGDVLLGLADVDLIRVNLQLVLGAVDTLTADDSGTQNVGTVQHDSSVQNDRAETHASQRNAMAAEQHDAVRIEEPRSDRPAASGTRATAVALPPLDGADRADLGVGGLLVAVIEIVHRLLERQAIHRMERGSLTSEQTERLGQALMALDQRINQLIEIFGVRSSSALPATLAGTAH